MATKEKKVVVETAEEKALQVSVEIKKVEKEAKGIEKIKTQAEYENASKFLSGVVKPRVNRITELVDFFTKPFKEQRKVALAEMNKLEDLFDKQLAPLQKIESEVKNAMRVFLVEQDRIAKEEEAKMLAKRDKQNEKREAKGQEPIMTPVPVIERVATTVKNEDGGKTIAKKIWTFEVVDMVALRQDKVFMENLFLLATNKGLHNQIINQLVGVGTREIKGVRIYEDFNVSAKAEK